MAQGGEGKTFPVINPSTGEEICRVEKGTKVWIQATVFYDRFLLFFIGGYW